MQLNSLNHINWDALIDHCTSNKKATIGVPEIKSSNFVPYCLGLFGSIQPAEGDETLSKFKATYARIPSEIVYRNEIITKTTLSKLFKFFALVNPMCYSPVPQIKNKVFNGAVPIFMYGQKLYNNIPYEAWKTEDYKTLQAIVPYAFNRPEVLDYDWKYHTWKTNESEFPGEIERFRVRMVTPYDDSARASFTSYKNNKIYRRVAKEEFTGEPGSDLSAQEVRDKAWDALPSIVRQMIAQTWIFAPEVRLVDRQIMDLQNWDNVPAPLDTRESNMRVKDTSPASDDFPF